jgi:hypothetical protein
MRPFIYHENPSGTTAFMKSGDSFAVDENRNIFVVADSPLRCLIRDTKSYPFDDHGFEAADTFCKSFVENGKLLLDSGIFTEDSFRELLVKSNSDLKRLNEELGKKYNDKENYDITETVGMGALIKDDTLYYGGLEDCYVNVLRGEDLKDVATIDYQIMKADHYLNGISAKGELEKYIPEGIQGKLRKEHEWEPCWCNYLRNNFDLVDEDGQHAGWGCFTGEESAEPFFQVHSLKLEKGDRILVFSDGMIPVLDNQDFLKWFVANNESTFTFQYLMSQKIMELLKDDKRDNERGLIYLEY